MAEIGDRVKFVLMGIEVRGVVEGKYFHAPTGSHRVIVRRTDGPENSSYTMPEKNVTAYEIENDRSVAHTEEWFDYAFTNPCTDTPYDIPPELRSASEKIIRSYGIQGICDPMYIANIIAMELGLGDGKGNFNLDKKVEDKG